MPQIYFTGPDELEIIYMFNYDNNKSAREQTYLGNPKPNRKCLFCGRNETETLFKGISHVIPGGLGNKFLFSNEECFDCNQKAGQNIENDFIKAIEPFRLFSQQGGATRQVELKKPGMKSFFKSVSSENKVEIVGKEDADKLFEEINSNKIKLKIPVNTFNPIAVSKELARLGLFVSNELRTPEYECLKQWIRGERDIFPSDYCYVWSPGGSMNSTTLSVWKYTGNNRTEKSPKYFVMLMFGCVAFIYHFLNLEDNAPESAIWPVPALLLAGNEFGNPLFQIERVMGNGKNKGKWIEIEMSAGNKTNLPKSD